MTRRSTKHGTNGATSCRVLHSWPRVPTSRWTGAIVMSGSEALMPTLPTIARVTDDDTTEAELLAFLHECSRYPQSDARTRSTDVLLDLLIAWAGV